MRGAAITLLFVGTGVAIAYTLLGPFAGVNKFRIVVEVLILATAIGAVATTMSSRRAKGFGVILLFGGGAMLALCLLPPADPIRKELLAPVVTGEERGLVLLALGRPDFVSDGGIGTAQAYGFRSSSRPHRILVLCFSAGRDNDDVVQSSEWLEESEAQITYKLQAPGYP